MSASPTHGTSSPTYMTGLVRHPWSDWSLT